jgi:hypothetical protein
MSLTPENKYTSELLDEIYKNSVINGLGLVITAVIQTIEKQLDLYHAIVVMQILFSLSFVYTYGMVCIYSTVILKSFTEGTGQRRPYNKTDFRMKVYIGVQTFTTVVFTVWLLYVWIKGSNFGSQKACNHLVKYVVFIIDIRATVTWLRILFIINLIITASVLLVSFGVNVHAYVKWRRTHKYEELLDVPVAVESRHSIQSPIPQSQGQPEQKNDPGRKVRNFSVV